MAEAGFLFEVVRVFEIEEEVEIRQWQWGPNRGRGYFRPGSTTGPARCREAGFIRDVAGDLYRLPSPERWTSRAERPLAFVD